MSGYLDKWQAAADDFLSVVLTRLDAWKDGIEAGISQAELPPGNWRRVWHVTVELRGDYLKAEKPPVVLLDTEVAAKCGSSVSPEWVAERIALVDAYREQGFTRTCVLLEQYGRGHRQVEALATGQKSAVAALDGGQSADAAALRAVDELRREHQTGSGDKPVEIGALVDVVEAEMAEEPTDVLKTGVWLLDEWIRGMGPGEFIAWAAPYKMRKTSTAACVIVNMARAGESVTVFSYDEPCKKFTYRIQALLMAEYMWHHKHWDLCAEDGTPLNVVDATMIRNAGKRWRNWPLPLQQAREYAVDEMRKLSGHIRIYDVETGANSLQSIRGICQYDAMKYGGLNAVFVDHIQRLPGFDKTYEAVEYGSSELHRIGSEMGALMWVLSQQNEEAIRGKDDGGWSPNVKGGGGLASNADVMFMSKYKVGTITDPHYLRLELKLARSAEAPAYGYVEIHPASGWITPRRVDTKTLVLDQEN